MRATRQARTGSTLTPRDDSLVRDIARSVRKRLDPITAKIEALEARVAELEGRSLADTYGGVHDSERAYQRGTTITHDGALWLAVGDAEAGARPGKSAAWRMILKSGG